MGIARFVNRINPFRRRKRSNLADLRSTFDKLLGDWRTAREEGRFAEVAAISSEIMDTVQQMAMEEPPTPEFLIGLEASLCEENGDWAGAEACYRKVLELELAADAPVSVYSAYADLSSLKALLNEHETAYELAKLATAAARPCDSPMMLNMALVGQAWSAVLLGRIADAEAAASEAISILGTNKLYNTARGQALVARAYCRFEQGNRDTTASDLEAAWKCLAPMSIVKEAAGVHSPLASYWSIKAKMLADDGDWASAAAAWQKAIDHRRTVAGLLGVYTQNALARTLWQYAEAATRAGAKSEAESALAESQSIRKRLNLRPFVSRRDLISRRL